MEGRAPRPLSQYVAVAITVGGIVYSVACVFMALGSFPWWMYIVTGASTTAGVTVGVLLDRRYERKMVESYRTAARRIGAYRAQAHRLEMACKREESS